MAAASIPAASATQALVRFVPSAEAFVPSGMSKDGILAVLSKRCPLQIDLSQSHEVVDDEVLNAVALHCKDTVVLNIAHGRWSLEGLIGVLTKCEQLTSLNISGRVLPRDEMIKLALYLSRLSQLTITGMIGTPGMDAIQAKFKGQLFSKNPHKTLRCETISRQGLKPELPQVVNLREVDDSVLSSLRGRAVVDLKITNSTKWSLKALTDLLVSCASLSSLDISGRNFSDDEMVKLAPFLSRLSRFTLSGVIGTPGIREISDKFEGQLFIKTPIKA